MSSIVCMEQKYEKVRKMQIFSEFFYEGGENPCGLPDGVPAKKEFPPPEGTRTGYEGENETYIEASVENSGSILYDKEIRNKPRTRRTKRNV